MNAIIIASVLDWLILTLCGFSGTHSWIWTSLIPILIFVLCVGIGIRAEVNLSAEAQRKAGEVGSQ
jgi:uncharacterized membrane protein